MQSLIPHRLPPAGRADTPRCSGSSNWNWWTDYTKGETGKEGRIGAGKGRLDALVHRQFLLAHWKVIPSQTDTTWSGTALCWVVSDGSGELVTVVQWKFDRLRRGVGLV